MLQYESGELNFGSFYQRAIVKTIEGLELKIARIRVGLRQYELAARVGITQTKLSEIECGRRRLTPELSQHIMEALEEAQGARASKD